MLINGVFSGGGMKGFALVGAIIEAEKLGYEFNNVAGTSAGAIVSALLAAGYTGEEMKKILMDAPRSKFLDSNFRTISFVKWLLLYWKLGLYKGQALEKWLEKTLSAKGVSVFGDLPENKLRIVVSDVSNDRLITLPDDLVKYNIDPKSFSIARAVRMSSSIPFVFQPARLNKDVIVDGGILSNFPIWLFQNSEIPVLGIKLTPKEKFESDRKIENAVDMFGALFNTMRNAHDLQYISRKVEKNIIFIQLNNAISTDFEMSKEECEEVLKIGQKKAKEFFKTWIPDCRGNCNFKFV